MTAWTTPLAVSSIDNVVAVGSGAHGVSLVALDTGARVRLLQVETTVVALAFSPRGGALAISGTSSAAKPASERHDSSIEVVSPDGKPLWTKRDIEVSWSGTAFSPDGSLLASCGIREAVLTLRSARSGEVVRTIPAPTFFNGFAFSPDGSKIAIAGGRHLWICSVADGATQLEARIEHGDPTCSIAWSARGDRLALARWSSVDVLDAATGRTLTRVTSDVELEGSQRSASVAFTSKGDLLVGGTLVRLYDAATLVSWRPLFANDR